MSEILHMGVWGSLHLHKACIPRDVVVCILFPYLLPSLPIYKDECWSKDIRGVLEELLTFYCDIDLNKIQELLETFVKRMLHISSFQDRNLDDDLHFLTDIKNKTSFKTFNWKSSVYSLYMCNFLIENKLSINRERDHALRWCSKCGHQDTVALLLQHKADVHASDEYALRWASKHGYKDVVELLLQHKADVHARNDHAFRSASYFGFNDTVALLLEHKADVHADNDFAIRDASYNGFNDTIALLLDYKANIHVNNGIVLRSAIQQGHTDTVALLVENGSKFPNLQRHKVISC
jgi:ankyrin repeat protein